MATSNKGGYDCEFVTAPPKSLECPICLLTVCQPHVISCCGNQFCQACIGRIQQDNKPCPLCNEVNFTTFLHKGVMREVNSLMVYCPNKKDGCDWKGELGQLEEHLNPSVESNTGKECGYVLVACRYKCGEMFLRKAVLDHENELCTKCPMEVQVVSLAKKLESLSSKLDAVIAENTELKVENQKRIMDITKLKMDNEKHKKECEKLGFENKEMKKKIDDIHCLKSCVMPAPPFYFTMDNVSLYMKTDSRWQSSPFYSSNGGYKLQARVYPNGFGSKGKYLSLFFAVMRGEYDDKLKWPFTGRITVELYNRCTESWCLTKTLTFHDADSDVNRKPQNDCLANAEWGYYQFLSHQELRKSYLDPVNNYDFLRFRISRVDL